MKKEDYRQIEYDIDRNIPLRPRKNGLFHALVKKLEDNGEEFYRVLIEDENGNLIEVHRDSIRFID